MFWILAQQPAEIDENDNVKVVRDKMVATGEQSITTTLVLPSASRALFHKSSKTTTSFVNGTAQQEGWREQQEDKSLHMTLKSDLTCLLEGTVKCTKPKPPSTKETRKEAFHRYMKIIYRVPHNIKVEFDDSDEISFEPEPYVNTPYISIVEDTPPPTLTIIPVVKAKKKKCRKKKAAPSDDGLSYIKEEPEPVVLPPKPVIHEKPAFVKEEIILPKIPTPPPPPTPKPVHAAKPLALPPREPSPELPEFLREFLKREWFKQLYPDKKDIPSSLCPDSFFLQLVDYLSTCNSQFKMEILSVLQTLHRRNLLQNIDQLYQKLLESVPKLVAPNMSATEQAVLGQVLNLLMYMKSLNEELVKTLLTLVAYKDLGPRKRMLQMLKSLGVDEAEQWLWPELETWESELHNKTNMWKSFYTFAGCWLNLWSGKYKGYIRDLFLRSTEKWKPPSFTAVDVLNYFCSLQKEEYLKAKQVAPRAKNTVLLPHNCISGPIHRLGETYSMARIRRHPNLILPPLRDRPSLWDFPNFISLPLPRVKLSPFYTDSEEDRLKFLDHRYYILEKSHVDYYR